MSTKLDRPNKENKKSALLAVSGGVDSIVLLNLLCEILKPTKTTHRSTKLTSLISNFVEDTCLTKIELIYTDHGQREDTDLDTNSILLLAKKFDLMLHIVPLNLPKESSEQLARQKRYDAFDKTKKERGLDHIITAHHADDVLETALINLTRGTGPKGLSSLQHQPNGIWRPFLYKLEEEVYITKQDILDYAKQENLTWHEDSTNTSEKYLRNQIRHRLGKVDKPESRLNALRLISKSIELTTEISTETDQIEKLLRAENGNDYSIELFKLLPEEIKDQFLHKKITEHGFDVSKQSISLAKEFVQTKTTGKVLQLKGCEVRILRSRIFSFVSLTDQKLPK